MAGTASSRLSLSQGPSEPLVWDSRSSGSQESGLCSPSRALFFRDERGSLGECVHITATESSKRVICLHTDLLLPSPPQFLASSPTQLPKLESSKSFLSSHRPLEPHLHPVPGLGPAPSQWALSRTRPSGHTLLHQAGRNGLLPPLTASASHRFSSPPATLLLESKTVVLGDTVYFLL